MCAHGHAAQGRMQELNAADTAEKVAAAVNSAMTDLESSSSDDKWDAAYEEMTEFEDTGFDKDSLALPRSSSLLVLGDLLLLVLGELFASLCSS